MKQSPTTSLINYMEGFRKEVKEKFDNVSKNFDDVNSRFDDLTKMITDYTQKTVATTSVREQRASTVIKKPNE